MTKAVKSIISVVLTISMLLCAVLPAFAAGEEEYVCDLRLIYADDYNEAKGILEDGEFRNYKLLKENLNAGTDEIGVWLAYKTTTNIEDAITDIAVMQMNGGYKEGNYQEMIKQSYDAYVAMGVLYLDAIEYFMDAYESGHYLAEAAFRQLNFYNVESEGIPKDKIPDFEGERIGDIFYEGIDEYELATIFFEGNSYALQNIRALLAMGVSYNSDGKTYLEKVADSVEKVKADPTVFDEEDYDDLAELLATSIIVIKDMLKELSAYESDLNYTDDEFTSEELGFAENKAVADMLRKVNYLGDKTLYQFCLDYTQDEDDYSSLYPLVDALNDGQIAMTKLAHYYDVLRYSMSEYPEELMDSELDEMENLYRDNPFNIYSGVDRSIYNGTFALTSEAYRAEAYSEVSLQEALFGEDDITPNIVAGAIGVGLFVWAIVRNTTVPAIVAATKATAALKSGIVTTASQNISKLGYPIYMTVGGESIQLHTFGDMINTFLVKYNLVSPGALPSLSVYNKYQLLMSKSSTMLAADKATLKHLTARINTNTNGQFTSYDAYKATIDAGSIGQVFSNVLFIVGGVLMIYSAFTIAASIYNYYHPDYEDIPLAMVDLISTVDGDRYIKYDVVFEAETNDDGVYEAADLNAFEAQRWNALYYTKSYEAGKPLLADTFAVSTSNNNPKDNYAPVHGFGELVCYNLNRYNFDYNTNIFLSVKQSKNNKSAVADVPEVIGSMFGVEFLVLAGGIGAFAGAGGTLITHGFLNKKKSRASRSNAQEGTVDN